MSEFHWRYGLLKTKQPDGSYYYAVHEFYDGMDDDKPDAISWTEHETAASGETPEEVIEVLEMMIKDIKHWPPHEEKTDE